MDPLGESGGEGLDPFVAHILVIVPGPSPPAPAGSVGTGGGEVGIDGGGGECGVEGLKTGGQPVDEGDVVAPGGDGHRQFDADPGTGVDEPAGVGSLDVVGVVDGLVVSLDGKSLIFGREPSVPGGVIDAESVVHPALAVALEDDG